LRRLCRGFRVRIMRVRRANWGMALIGAAVITLCGAYHSEGFAQEWWDSEGSTASGPTLDEYLQQIGSEGKLIPQGQLKIDGRSVSCGKRPTVLYSNFDSWGGAFPGFLILNTKKITGLSTPVKLYVYSHECGHQFIGADETKADLFAIRRGVKYGWLDAQGMDDICVFISQLKGDSVHPPGPQRCDTMRKYFEQLVGESGQQTQAPATTTKAHTLAPAQ
jgi:hypothetical protein